ncbi:hypothetical protein NFI96_017305 [Prochilodus magdalenae]|nr:hypothetical protein NFI96_017305 [Prochilodus magdalenae]
MKFQVFLVATLLVCSLGLAGYIHNKKDEEFKLAKHASFQNVKHRVTGDVLKEYMTHVVESSSLLDKTKKQIEDLKVEVTGAQEGADGKRAEAETCTGELKRMTDEVASIDTEKANADGEFQKKKGSLQEQIANLKKEIEQPSKVCDYIKKDSAEGKKLCGTGLSTEPAKVEGKPVEPAEGEKKKEEPKSS